MSIFTPSYIQSARSLGKPLIVFAYSLFVLMLVFMGIHITSLFDPADSIFFEPYANAPVSRNIGYSTYMLADPPHQSSNDNYPNTGGPGPLSWTNIGQKAVGIMQSTGGSEFWLFGVLLSAVKMIFIAVLVVACGDHLSAFIWGMGEWMECRRMECLWLIDFNLWIVTALEIVVSYIPEKRMAEDGARRANVTFPTTQEELSGAAKDPLPLDEHTECVQEDLKPDLASVPEKLSEPLTPIRSAKPPFPRTDTSRKPFGLGIDVPRRNYAPITMPASLNWADIMRRKKKSAGESTKSATHIMEIEELQSYLTDDQGLVAMLSSARLLFEASGAGTAPTIKPITLVSKVSSLRSTDIPSRSRKEHTGVSEARYEAGIRSGRQRPVERKQAQKDKPEFENRFAGALVRGVEEMQPYYVELAESECGAELEDSESVPAILDSAGVVSEAQKLDTTLPPSSPGFNVPSEAQELIILPPASSTNVQVYEGQKLEATPPIFPHVISEALHIRQTKLESPLKKENWGASSGGCRLSPKPGKLRKGNLKRDQTKEFVDGKVYDAPGTRKTKDLPPNFTGEEPKENLLDGGSVLTLLDTVRPTLEAKVSESAPSASSVSVQVISRAPIAEGITPASDTSAIDAACPATDAPKPEIPTPTIPPIAISEILLTRPAKLENPLKKKSHSTRRCDLYLRLGRHRQGDRKHDQARKLAVENFAATHTKGIEEEWQISLRRKRAHFSTLLLRNRHRITKRTEISTMSLYEGCYTVQRVVDVCQQYKKRVQARIQRVPEEFCSDAMMLDQEIPARQLTRYAEWVMSSKTQIAGRHKMPEARKHVTPQWRKSLKKKRARLYSTKSILKSHYRRPKASPPTNRLPLGQKSHYTARRALDIHQRNTQRVKARIRRIGNALQTGTPENLDCGSDPNLLLDPEERLENLMKGISSDKNEVETETAVANDAASSEPATTSPSARIGTELSSLNNTIAPKKETCTSTSGRIGVAMQREQESALSEPTKPTTLFVTSTIVKNPLKYKPRLKDLALAASKVKEHEETKYPMGGLTGEEPKWASGPGGGSEVSGTLSPLAVPPEETATNASGATDIRQDPTTMDMDDESTDTSRLTQIDTKPLVPPVSPKDMEKNRKAEAAWEKLVKKGFIKEKDARRFMVWRN